MAWCMCLRAGWGGEGLGVEEIDSIQQRALLLGHGYCYPVMDRKPRQILDSFVSLRRDKSGRVRGEVTTVDGVVVSAGGCCGYRPSGGTGSAESARLESKLEAVSVDVCRVSCARAAGIGQSHTQPTN